MEEKMTHLGALLFVTFLRLLEADGLVLELAVFLSTGMISTFDLGYWPFAPFAELFEAEA